MDQITKNHEDNTNDASTDDHLVVQAEENMDFFDFHELDGGIGTLH